MSVTEDLTPFERDLQVRGLLDHARSICVPYGLRADQLRRTPGKRTSPSILVEVRRIFVAHLVEHCGWSHSMAAALLGYKDRYGIHFVLGLGGAKKKAAAERRTKKLPLKEPPPP